MLVARTLDRLDGWPVPQPAVEVGGPPADRCNSLLPRVGIGGTDVGLVVRGVVIGVGACESPQCHQPRLAGVCSLKPECLPGVGGEGPPWWRSPVHDAQGLVDSVGTEVGIHRGAVACRQFLSLIHISEPTRRTPISYAVFCLK